MMKKPAADKIQFHYLSQPFTFRRRRGLKAFLIELFAKEGRTVEAVNYVFCTDEYLLQINQDYLKHDTYTDIITFEFAPKGQAVVSDIYISIERVKENAFELGQSFQLELHRVLLHGALHLCGYKDKNVKQAKQMRQKEDSYLNSYFVSRERQSSNLNMFPVKR